MSEVVMTKVNAGSRVLYGKATSGKGMFLNAGMRGQQANNGRGAGSERSTVQHIVLIGNAAPRQCGIATFSSDLTEALVGFDLNVQTPGRELQSRKPPRVSVVAMNDNRRYDYPEQVAFSIDQNDLDAYIAAATRINALAPDAVSVQHEYGIFGGQAGAYLLTLLRGLNAPIVTTLHTVLETPNPEQAAVLEELSALSKRLVVMSERAVGLLERQGVPRSKICFIPHGAPQIEFDPAEEKARLGVADRSLILTFGLLGRGKGLEQAIRALPEVVRVHPDALYLILGATHPHVLAHEGEAYRDELWALARELGVEGNLRMDNRFVSAVDLRRALAAADIYLTPYPNPAQITSGTLAYAVGNGKAVVSTPYWYAEELLSEGRGRLVPFHDSQPMAQAISELLSDPQARAELGRRAGEFGRAMTWPQVAGSYLSAMTDAAQEGVGQEQAHQNFESRTLKPASALPAFSLPAFSLEHFVTLSDGTGMFQHATGAIPNPHEGYTTDDNARALQLLCEWPGSGYQGGGHQGSGRQAVGDQLARTYMGFMHYALDEQSGKFRNFLSYDRRWLEQVGAENAQARSVRALAVAANSPAAAIADTALELMRRQKAALDLESPRAQGIALLAAAEVYRQPRLLAESGELLAAAGRYAANLARLHDLSRKPGWDWFENYLSYANAELPHGLIAYGQASGDRAALKLGLRTLAWLSTQQSGPNGEFWPVGSDRVYVRGEARPFWDGQPIEASVTVSACVAAADAQPEARELWLGRAQAALNWLLGDNPLGLPLLDRRTGGSHDGLHHDRLSINQGAESTILLWQAVQDLRRAEEQQVPVNLSAD